MVNQNLFKHKEKIKREASSKFQKMTVVKKFLIVIRFLFFEYDFRKIHFKIKESDFVYL